MGSGWRPTGLSSSDYTVKGFKSHSTGDIGAALGSDHSKPLKPPTPPPPLPQASQSPDAQAVRTAMSGMGQAGGAPGIAQTFLTGASGIDSSTLTLGKNLLLGT